MSMSSLSDDMSLCATSQTYSTFQQMDAPPPTPLYTPSERDERSSVLLGPLGLDVMSRDGSLLTDFSYEGPPKTPCHINCMCHTNKQKELYPIGTRLDVLRPAPSL